MMLELRGIRSTLSLSLFPDQLWPEVVAPDSVLSMCQIEHKCGFKSYCFAFKLRIYAKLNCLK